MKRNKTLTVILCAVIAIAAVSAVCMSVLHHDGFRLHEYNDHESDAPSVYESETSEMRSSSFEDIISYKNMKYGENSVEYFDLFIPEDIDRSHAPLILFVHGGGWRHGECEDFLPQCKEYAKKGFVTATISYSLLSSDTPEVTFSFMMDEFIECVAEINHICKEKGIILSGMALYGYSAGAHLSLLYAYSMDEVSPVPVKTVFAMAPPTDFNLSSWTESSYWEDENEIAEVISLASGKHISGNIIRSNPDLPEEISDLSPLTFIDKDTVPTALAHGSLDITVPKIHSDLVSKRLKKYEISHTFIVFEHSTHLLENDPEAMREWDRTVDEYTKKYLIRDVGQIE